MEATAVQAEAPSALAPVIPSLSYRLIERLELHLGSNDLSEADLRAIRRAGGDYNACRGHDTKRFVHIPGGARELFERIVASVQRAYRPESRERLIICRGPIETFGHGLMTHFKPGLALAAIESAAERVARAHGRACACCGELVSTDSWKTKTDQPGVYRCPDCQEERARYQEAARAAAAAGARYDLAIECYAAALSTGDPDVAIQRVFERLGGAS